MYYCLCHSVHMPYWNKTKRLLTYLLYLEFRSTRALICCRSCSTLDTPLPFFSRALAVFEILGSNRNGVTTLTFQGHVTSSVTWLFNPRRPFPIGARLEPSLYVRGRLKMQDWKMRHHSAGMENADWNAGVFPSRFGKPNVALCNVYPPLNFESFRIKT